MSERKDAQRLDEAIATLLSGTPLDLVLARADRDLAPYLRAFNQLQFLQPAPLPPPSEEFRLRLRAKFVQGANHETRVAPRGRGGRFQRAAVAGAASLILGSALNPALAQELVHHVRETMGRAAADVLNAALFIERQGNSESPVPQRHDAESSPPGNGANEQSGAVNGDTFSETSGGNTGSPKVADAAVGEDDQEPDGSDEDLPGAVPPHAPGPPEETPPATADGPGSESAAPRSDAPEQPVEADKTAGSPSQGSDSQGNKPALPPVATEDREEPGDAVENPTGGPGEVNGGGGGPGAPGSSVTDDGPPGIDDEAPPGLDGDSPPGHESGMPPVLDGDEPPGHGGEVPGNSGASGDNNENGNGPPEHAADGNEPPEHATAGGQPPSHAAGSDSQPGQARAATNDEPTGNTSPGASTGNSSISAATPQSKGQGLDKSEVTGGPPKATGDTTASPASPAKNGDPTHDSAANEAGSEEPEAGKGKGSSGGGAAANGASPGQNRPKGRTTDDDDEGGSGDGPDPDLETEPGAEPRRDLSRVRATNRGTGTGESAEQAGTSWQQSEGSN